MKKLKILTVNRHESYLVQLAKTNHDFDVIEEWGRYKLTWRRNVRIPPPNIKLIRWDKSTVKKLEQGYYDYIICHTLFDLVRLIKYRKCNRFIFIEHIALFFQNVFVSFKSYIKKILLFLAIKTARIKVVSISQFKSESWGFAAKTILTPPSIFPPVNAKENTEIVVVGNHLATRQKGLEMGYDLICKLKKHFDITIIGDNPTIPQSIRPKTFEDFINVLSRGSIYLYTTRYPFNDGFNLALLEAMAMGFAVVTIEHPTSPIKDKINGLVAKDVNEFVSHINFLQNNPDKRKIFGDAARITINEVFSETEFLKGWDEVFESKGTTASD